VGESPVALAEATILLRCLLEEWAHGVANAGVAATGTAAIGTATGTGAIGTAIGTGAIGTAIGTAAIGIIVAISMTMMTLIMSSSLVASRSGAGAGGIRMDIPAMAMDTHTAMATHTVTMAAVTTGATVTITGTATATDMVTTRKLPSYSADFRTPDIIGERSTEFLVLARATRCARTGTIIRTAMAITIMEAHQH